MDQVVQDIEITLLRRELYHTYLPILKMYFIDKDIKKALHYFIAMPTEVRKGRTSLEMILECCRAAKEYE